MTEEPAPKPLLPLIEREGWYKQYVVRRTDGLDMAGAEHEHCQYLVLDLNHDPDGRTCALLYADLIQARGQIVRAHHVRGLASALSPEYRETPHADANG